MAQRDTIEVHDVEIGPRQQLWGDGGFARLRRCEARNVRGDGSRSDPYTLDLVERPQGTDAVAVFPYERRPDGAVRVLLRRGLRPAARLGRAGEPTREGAAPPLLLIEAVAGIIELGDRGEQGLRLRAARELEEEVGLRVDPARVAPLGPPVFLSPGLSAERIYYLCVEAALDGRGAAGGDGSLLEEGGDGALYEDLSRALADCRSGRIQDAKTEVGLRRLQELLAAP